MNLHQAQAHLSRVLRDNLFERRVLSTSGALEFNRLARYKTSKRVFSRKQANSGKHYNFHILIDFSGSMRRGYRAYNMIQSLKNMIRLLKHVTNIKIYSFDLMHTSRSIDEIMAMPDSRDKFEDWFEDEYIRRPLGFKVINGERHTCKLELADESYDEEGDYFTKSKLEGTWAGAGNREICNLVSVRKKIKNDEGRNVILILQDGSLQIDYKWMFEKNSNVFIAGEPVSKYTDHDYIKQQIKMISRSVELVSFGIQTENPERYYPNFVYIKDPNDIYKNIITLFERLITN